MGRRRRRNWMDFIVCNFLGATLLSSASIAILEPTLPVLLGHTFKTPRWKIGQLNIQFPNFDFEGIPPDVCFVCFSSGTVFLPDSTGYFIGTYFFTSVTRHQLR